MRYWAQEKRDQRMRSDEFRSLTGSSDLMARTLYATPTDCGPNHEPQQQKHLAACQIWLESSSLWPGNQAQIAKKILLQQTARPRQRTYRCSDLAILFAAT